MTAEFSYRNTDYVVFGWLWSDDGDRNGVTVRRADGRPIRGEKTDHGVQMGISASLQRAAERALEAERVAWGE